MTSPSPSTVGRGRSVAGASVPTIAAWSNQDVDVRLGDSIDLYAGWESPDVIVSDGAYGILGFDGDTSDHLGVPGWYRPHVRAWAARAKPSTTLWFWNSEIGWAAAHPVLEEHGFRYVQANVWDKGIAHVAGNVNTAKIRRFPVVTEVCVQYAVQAKVGGATLKEWLRSEWDRAGLTLRQADEACGTRNVASRKYLSKDHLWYWPPAEMFARLSAYANEHGTPAGRPYFSMDGARPAGAGEWAATRSTFRCPHGVTNVWQHPPLSGRERVKAPGGRAAHLNQKPAALMERIILASSDPGAVVWEPFGGLFSASIAAMRTGRRAFGGEVDPTYFQIGAERLAREIARERR